MQTSMALNALEGRIAGLEEEDITALKYEVADLTNSVAETNTKIDDIDEMMNEVVIVSGEEAAGDEKCVKVCAGTTGREATDWTDYGSHGVYEDVDISNCGFIKIPTVTAAIEGKANQWRATGTSSIYNTSP